MSVIWLVSYPKSGNTWTRAFLTAYLNGGQVNINSLLAPTAGARRPIDRLLGIDSLAYPTGEIESLRPEVYRRMNARALRNGRDPIMVKVHDLWKVTPRGEPLFPPEITRSVVYIVRNPIDVAASFAHHLGIPPDKAAEHVCNETFTLALFGFGLKQQVPQLLGSWRTHMQSWLDRPGQAVYLMKYEDMRKDPAAAFTALMAHIGLEKHPAIFDQALRASSLPALQAQELISGFREKSIASDTAFFRQGKVGTGDKELSVKARAHIMSYCGDQMRRLGYL